MGDRWLENVVLMPDDKLNEMARCKVISREFDDAQPRGTIAVDMDELYKVQKPKVNPKWGEGPDIVDGGIHGRRAFAVDLSGQSGAPAVIAVADKITGGGRKVWQMFSPDLTAEAVTTDGNKFVIKKGDTTLVGTVVSPKDAKISVLTPAANAKPTPNIPDAAFRGIRIEGADPKSSDFWVVMTLQRGDAVPVKVTGSGLDAKVQVGKAKLAFREDKLVWE